MKARNPAVANQNPRSAPSFTPSHASGGERGDGDTGLSFRGLREAARLCVEEAGLDRKVELSRAVAAEWRTGGLALETDDELPEAARTDVPLHPGLPDGLELTAPTRVKRRGFGSPARRAAFVHAIAHIEWNAINLAWDAVWRFGGMPRDYYDDWTRVAVEEAGHFEMLRRRLHELGSEYGRLPAHGGLWETADATRHDLLARMALVPRVLEARGLDVTPGLIARLRGHGDEATAAILDVVLREEVGHVRIGSRWFHHLCDERGLAAAAAFSGAIREHFRGRPRAVADETSRRLRLEAGFRPDELAELDALDATGGRKGPDAPGRPAAAPPADATSDRARSAHGKARISRPLPGPEAPRATGSRREGGLR